MAELKTGKKDAIKDAAKRFDKIKNQPVSKRISDFLRNEGKKERDAKNPRKIAHPNSSKDLDI
jgi:hypothetical protein